MENKEQLQTNNNEFRNTLIRMIDNLEEGGGGGASIAEQVGYDNRESGLDAINVQQAIDELHRERGSVIAAEINYDSAESGMDASNVQDAIDELQHEKGPMWTYGTEDIGAGAPMDGPEGSLYFVIE